MSERLKDVGSPAASKSMRPALIASERTLSDYALFLHHLLVGLADESIPVVLVCPPDCDVDFLLCGNMEVVRHPAIRLPFLGRENRRRLVEQLLRFKPTVVHCLCESRAALSRHLARQLGLPYLLMVNSLYQAAGTLSISAKHCVRIIAPAKSIADDLATTYPRLAERIEQINVGTFAEDNSLCFSDSSRLACMVLAHPMHHVADFENLLSAVRHLVIGGYEFAVVIMGAGRAERSLRRLLAALGLGQTVTIVPRLQPWRPVLAAGDVFIRPQPRAAFDPLLLEAMGVGSAVAACKGGVDDLIVENQTAVVFDPADELSIRASLQRLFDRPEFARKLAKGAQGHLRENHSVSSMISATLEAYRQAQEGFQQ